MQVLSFDQTFWLSPTKLKPAVTSVTSRHVRPQRCVSNHSFILGIIQQSKQPVLFQVQTYWVSLKALRICLSRWLLLQVRTLLTWRGDEGVWLHCSISSSRGSSTRFNSRSKVCSCHNSSSTVQQSKRSKSHRGGSKATKTFVSKEMKRACDKGTDLHACGTGVPSCTLLGLRRSASITGSTDRPPVIGASRWFSFMAVCVNLTGVAIWTCAPGEHVWSSCCLKSKTQTVDSWCWRDLRKMTRLRLTCLKDRCRRVSGSHSRAKLLPVPQLRAWEHLETCVWRCKGRKTPQREHTLSPHGSGSPTKNWSEVNVSHLYRALLLSWNWSCFFSFPNTLVPTDSNTLQSSSAWHTHTTLSRDTLAPVVFDETRLE